ncbi:DgyrCDS2874 [Dimorphilus gyrociliatus]|uniref:Mitochondrial 2-oxodicarboxylate carrier n=1 Tax=Dimorphilus gyrociliatus TaxID=2664684 RepID=A0A7I8VDG5_9ANNE|nr:DgyrCDS2874 [Dimorphilus gyrociliatus]
MTDIQKQRSLGTLALMQIASGGSAGFVEVCLMHPLDLVKTRFQIQKGPDDPNRYKSIVDCFKKMYRQEGALSFYKGLLPPILAETPKRAVKFFTFEQYKSLFLFGASSPTPVTFALAGLCSGLTEGFLINPFEVVKVKLQADRQLFSQQLSAIQMAKTIYGENGFGSSGLNKGLTSTLLRHGIWNMIYFGLYHNLKNVVPIQKDQNMELGRKFVLGLMAGSIASTANIPFDVAKSRIQGPQPETGIKYKSCLQTIRLVYKEEGYLALYKGLLPKLLRLGPGGAIMLMVFDTVYEKLQNWF